MDGLDCHIVILMIFLGLLLTVGTFRWVYQSKSYTLLDGNQQTTKFLCDSAAIVIVFFSCS